MQYFYKQLKESFQNKSQKSFSLLEAIVAVAILLVAVSSVMNIVYEGAVASRFQQDRLIANYLAADAVEYLRSQRDSSLIAGNTFSDWLNSSRIQRCVGQSCRIDTRPGSSSITACSSGCRPLDYNESNGLYGYNSNWAESQFTRELEMTTRQSGNEVKITATVSWQRSGDTASVTLEESMFGWSR